MSDETATEDEGEAISSRLHKGIAALRDMPVAHGVLLALFALCTALILSLVDDVTRGPIADRTTEDLYGSLAQVIPGDSHDNDVTQGPVIVEDSVEGPVLVYRALDAAQVTGVAFEITSFGYAGGIKVLIGMGQDGVLYGARVLAHAETPGLGDKIEVAKDDWILGFSGLSMGNPGGWKVKKDGGQFDQFSGATITPRAVVEAVRRGLEFFDRNRDTLLKEPA